MRKHRKYLHILQTIYIKSNILCHILSLIYYWHIQLNMLNKGEINKVNKVAQTVANTKVEGPKKPKN